jgi:flagellar protein FlaG
MDTSLHTQAVASSLVKAPVRTANSTMTVGQVAAASSQFQGGSSLPKGADVGAKLPLSAAIKPTADKSSEANQSSEMSRMAAALATELSSPGNIERTEQAVAKLNEILKDRERDLEFSIDEDTGRTILKVIHAESGEVIRQIPPEELLNIARVFIEGTGSLIEDQA